MICLVVFFFVTIAFVMVVSQLETVVIAKAACALIQFCWRWRGSTYSTILRKLTKPVIRLTAQLLMFRTLFENFELKILSTFYGRQVDHQREYLHCSPSIECAFSLLSCWISVINTRSSSSLIVLVPDIRGTYQRDKKLLFKLNEKASKELTGRRPSS